MKKLSEYYGFGGRLDMTGKRGGLNRPLSVGADDFPYDKDLSYGLSSTYANNGKDAGDHALVPKDVEHTAAGNDDDIEDAQKQFEAGGVPWSSIMSDRGRGGSSGGMVIPSNDNSWSSYGDDDEIDDDELSAASDAYVSRMKKQESKAPWTVLEAFLSLKSTPEDPLDQSQDMTDHQLDVYRGEFDSIFDRLVSYLKDDETGHAAAQTFIDLDSEAAVDCMVDEIGKEGLEKALTNWRSMILGDVSDQEINDEDEAV